MNRADKMLAVLRDGRIHSRRDLWEAAGEFYLTNNAATELRLRGLNVAYDKKRDTYRLLSSLDETPALTASTVPTHSAVLPSSPAGVSSNEDGPVNPARLLLGDPMANGDDQATQGGSPVLVLFQRNIDADQEPLFAA